MPLTDDIEEVAELFTGRDGSYTDQFQRTYSRVFRVVTTREAVGPIAVQFAPGVPRVWDSYVGFGGTESDALAVCRKVTPLQNPDDPTLWEVRCEYSTAAPAPIGAQSSPPAPERPGAGGAADKPELRLPRISWDSQEISVPLRKDIKGKKVVNSAGDPFDPLPEILVGAPVLTVERYQLAFDQEFYAGFAYAVNRDPFLFAAAWQAQCLPVKGDTEQIGNRNYWKVRFSIRFFPDEIYPGHWQPTLLDAGYREKAFVGGVLKLLDIKDDRFNPVSKPVPLFDGRSLSARELKDSGPEYLEFKGYPEKDFSLLKLF